VRLTARGADVLRMESLPLAAQSSVAANQLALTE
jgi:hypothetical protein